MRRLVTTEAVVLRTRDWRESSRTVSLLTREHGLVTVIARGARRPRSRTAAALNLFCQSRITFYRRENRAIYNLGEAELLRAYSGISQLPERYFCAGRMAEFLLQVLPPLDANERLYILTVGNLAVVERAETGFEQLLAAFLLKAASFLGFRPELRCCVVCRQPVGDRTVWLDPARGGTVCRDCASGPGLMPLSPAELADLDRLLYSASATVATLNISSRPLDTVLSFLGAHFERLTTTALAWPKAI